SSRRLCGPDPQGRTTGRSARTGVRQGRIVHKHEDRQDARHCHSAYAARPRRRGDRVRRRHFLTLLGGAAAAWPLVARAQQPAMPVIGVMSPLSAATAARNLAALRNGLRDLGYNEGRNIKIEYRFADGAPERYPALMAELIALNPVLIVLGSTRRS